MILVYRSPAPDQYSTGDLLVCNVCWRNHFEPQFEKMHTKCPEDALSKSSVDRYLETYKYTLVETRGGPVLQGFRVTGLF